MKLLSVDTTTKKANVSLKIDDKIYSKSIDNEITHSEKFLPLIDELLTSTNTNLKDVEKYLILNGPGSFTGIRISLATIKAFAQINNKDIFSISSLEALAYLGFKKSNCNYIATFLDAKNDRVYFNLYYVENLNDKINISSLLEINNEYFEDAINSINDYTKANNINEFKSIGNFSNEFIDICDYPTTEDLLKIYESINDLKSYTYNCFTLDANYARKSQAERVLDEKD